MQRKTVEKLALIHWAAFQNEVIRLKGSTLFTGVNGSGKSTILDAVTYLLTANTQFNLAAKDRDRTVKAYVRGDTKSNGPDRYLRTGEVVSYLAMEFYSAVEQTHFVIGVCMESPNAADRCMSSWFIRRDTMLSDLRMAEVKDGTLRVFPKKQLLIHGKPVKLAEFMGRDKARAQILRVLGLRCDPESYRNKLVKMLAFNPENNVDQFIQNCVLEEREIHSLDELRAQKERFEELKGIFENLKISRQRLEEVEEKTQEFEAKTRLYESRRLMEKYQELLFARNTKEEIKTRIKALGMKLSSLSDELTETDRKKELARERYESARMSGGFMDMQSSIDAIGRQINELERSLRVWEEEVRKLTGLSQTLFGFETLLKEDYVLSGEERLLIECLDQADGSVEQKREAASGLIDRLTVLSMHFSEKRFERRKVLEEVSGKISEQTRELAELEKNRIPYPERCVRAKQALEDGFTSRQKKVQVRFFAELVKEVREPAWRRAVETFLGRKRFSIVVEDEYVQDALEIIREKNLFDAKIVLSDMIPDTEITHGSAAEILEIPNKGARKYANYLLNGIRLCDTLEELHAHPKGALMRDGMLAKSYSASKMEIKKTRLYMGADAIALQIKEIRKEKEVLEKESLLLSKEIKELEEKRRAIVDADLRIKDYRFEAPQRKDSDEKTRVDLAEQKSRLESDPAFAARLEEVRQAKKAFDVLEERANEIRVEHGGTENAIKEEQKRKQENAGELFRRENEYREYLEKVSDVEEMMLSDYEKLKKRSGGIRVIKKNTVERARTEADRAKLEMENVQLNYLRAAGMNLEKRGVSFIPFFREEKNMIANVKIEEASNKLEEHSKEMESTFMTDFVAELNESMLVAKREVSAINTELRQLPFGNDTYEFRIEEREDRSAFFRICRKLNDVGSMQMLRGLGRKDEELQDDIAGFMNRILEEQDEREFTDYRKYYKYDMKIRTKRGSREIESDFSRKQGSASNGEKQTPYFIILAASLMQCYPRDAECARLAFIDEAFAALSRERIEQMVGYLEDNGFQVMYAAPPEKISSIGDLIDTTVSLVPVGTATKLVEGLVR